MFLINAKGTIFEKSVLEWALWLPGVKWHTFKLGRGKLLISIQYPKLVFLFVLGFSESDFVIYTVNLWTLDTYKNELKILKYKQPPNIERKC